MGLIKRMLDEMKLYSRYSFRRLGFPGYQVHQIYLPEQQLLYIPIPKNACTSIKHALHEIEFGKRFDSGLPEFSDYREHHDYYKKRANAFTSVSRLKARTDATRFALVRDPVKRLLSCYRNRVVDLEDLKSAKATLKRMNLPSQPDINTFVMNLKGYRKAVKSIEHHSRCQSNFLGGRIDYLDRVFTLDDISGLVDMLRSHAPDLELLKRKKGGTKASLADLSGEALRHAVDFYRKDYDLLKKYVRPRSIIDEHKTLTGG